MGADLTPQKLEEIKLNFKKKRTESNHEDKLILRSPKLQQQSKDNLNITLKKLYKSHQFHKLNEEIKINNINNINSDRNTIKSEEKSNNNKNNLELLEEAKEINNIIFRNHKSFEPQISIFKQSKEEEKNLNRLKSSNIENDLNINSITITTMENTNIKIEPNSAHDSLSDNSDYIDISQSIFLNRNNKKCIFYKSILHNNAKNIRDAYYNKLIIKNIWKPYSINKKLNTLFLFDWDDTLMCTSAIMPIVNSCNLNINIKKIREKLKNLDENISNLLNKALERGIVFIISNASPGWVEYSSTNFLPLTAITLKKIKIISAKGLFSKQYPGDYLQWKLMAFKYVIESNNINTKLISNIICLGDSHIDLEAMESLRYYFNNGFIKVIKFKENPHLLELEKQIWIVISQLDFIIKKVKNLNLKVYKKKID